MCPLLWFPLREDVLGVCASAQSCKARCWEPLVYFPTELHWNMQGHILPSPSQWRWLLRSAPAPETPVGACTCSLWGPGGHRALGYMGWHEGCWGSMLGGWLTSGWGNICRLVVLTSLFVGEPFSGVPEPVSRIHTQGPSYALIAVSTPSPFSLLLAAPGESAKPMPLALGTEPDRGGAPG